jgi:hypothetical protein
MEEIEPVSPYVVGGSGNVAIGSGGQLAHETPFGSGWLDVYTRAHSVPKKPKK